MVFDVTTAAFNMIVNWFLAYFYFFFFQKEGDVKLLSAMFFLCFFFFFGDMELVTLLEGISTFMARKDTSNTFEVQNVKFIQVVEL